MSVKDVLECLIGLGLNLSDFKFHYHNQGKDQDRLNLRLDQIEKYKNEDVWHFEVMPDIRRITISTNWIEEE